MLSKIFPALAFLTLPTAAFYAGYRVTGAVFERKLITLPFEPFGVAIGLGCFFWTLAFLVVVLLKNKNRRLP